MHTEGEIRRAIRPLVEKYGQLTMSEVKRMLGEVLEFDKEDLEPSNSRKNETKIVQRIGNIRSHMRRGINVEVFDEGFIIDRTKKPAVFTAITGIKESISKIPSTEIKKRREKLKRRRTTAKVDWDEVDTIRKLIGDAGEEFVESLERDKVKMIDINAIDRVIRVSQKREGDGYDILSLNKKGNTVYIEVKTTQKGVDTAFYITENERLFLEEHKDSGDAFIYRVYNFNLTTHHGQIKIIKAKDFFNKYNIDPVTYKVTKK